MADPKADPTALLGRYLESMPADDILVVDPPSGAEAKRLADSTSKGVRFLCRDYGTWRDADAAGVLALHAAWAPDDLSEAAILYLPKGRARIRMTLEMLAGWLATDAPLWVVGPKRGGVGATRTVVEEFAALEGVESGKHCKLLRSRVTAHPVVSLRDFEELWTFEHAGQTLRVASYPGVFNHGALDDGTAMLLRSVEPLRSPALDIGCGCGVIGLALGGDATSLTMVDADALALVAATRTAELNRVNATISAADVFPTTGGRFMDIISNPPFHQGFETDHTVAARLIAQAPSRLLPGGRLTLVANRFLKLPPQLDAAFGTFDVLAEDGRFRVYRAG